MGGGVVVHHDAPMCSGFLPFRHDCRAPVDLGRCDFVFERAAKRSSVDESGVVRIGVPAYVDESVWCGNGSESRHELHTRRPRENLGLSKCPKVAPPLQSIVDLNFSFFYSFRGS